MKNPNPEILELGEKFRELEIQKTLTEIYEYFAQHYFVECKNDVNEFILIVPGENFCLTPEIFAKFYTPTKGLYIITLISGEIGSGFSLLYTRNEEKITIIKSQILF